MLEALTNPNSFFGKKIHKDIEWKTPVAIIAFLILVKIISSLILTIGAIGLFDDVAIVDGVENIGSYMMVMWFFIKIFTTIIGTLLWWLFYSALFYIVSSMFNAVGDFSRVMEFVSYGFLPGIFKSVIEIFYGNNLLSTLENSMDNPALTTEVMMSDPVMKIIPILMIIFTLWSGYIWVYGLSYSRNINIKNAAIAIAIPVLLSIIYTVFQYKDLIMW
ncbi:YIP1 family protein [Methanolobus vulcani]|uniref:YIP1 family protein n=1 Tax=Methanolobus vulcani TaxID=38026 RepID=A0A7Z8P253_9EURY|nr:YIP1 family protein [Methanolobus vulcani]TQD25049.1 YIP1 family protein [Methanolobus vulcani]